MFKTYIMMGIVFILLGLVMLFAPEGFIIALIVCIGIAALLNGILNITGVSKLIDDRRFRTAIIIRAVLSIIAGLLAIIFPIAFAKVALTVVVYIVAAELIVSAGIELYAIWKLRKAGIPFGIYVTEALITILLAVLLFLIPADIGILIIRIIGALVIAGGIAGIIWAFRIKREIEKRNEGSDGN